MINDEMISAADLLLTFEEEYQQMQQEIITLKNQQNSRQLDVDNQKKMLLDTVGANIQERIIPLGDKAVIITYHVEGNKLRISNRVVASDI